MSSDLRMLRPSFSKSGPDYSPNSPFFTLEVHHNGGFVCDDDGYYVTYKAGVVSYFDYCNLSFMNMSAIKSMLEELGYDPSKYDCFMLLTPVDWHQLKNDSDVDSLLGTLDNYKCQICVDKSKGGIDVDSLLDTQPIPTPTIASEKPPLDKNIETDSSSGSESDNEKSVDEDVDHRDLSESDYEKDDLEFLQHVDEDVEWAGLGDLEDKVVGEESDGDDHVSEPEFDSSDLDMSDSSVEDGVKRRNRKKWPRYKPKQQLVKFEIGMMFPSAPDLVEAIKMNSVQDGREIKFIKQESKRVRAVCTKNPKFIEKDEDNADDQFKEMEKVGCDWMVYGSMFGDDTSIQIKTLNNQHTCPRSFKNKTITFRWLGDYYLEKIRADPGWKAGAIKEHVMQDLKLNVSKTKCYRAKNWAKLKIGGSLNDQYTKLYQYAAELRRSNEGSNVVIVRDELDTRRFLRIYVCLAALKQGMKRHCRPLIGLDGCHLFGPAKGILLTAVSIDSNNGMYPVCYAVVESENKSSWKWFLELLKDDLEMENTFGLTFITDKQKGLMPAVDEVFPNSEHRCCVRHLIYNFSTHHRGMVLANALEAAAKATTVPEFKEKMAKLQGLSDEAAQWLEDKPPTQWSKAFFDTFVKSDMILNNLCESFNFVILDARGKPIISMLEKIKCILMKRVQVNRDKFQHHKGLLCPKIDNIIEKIKHEASFCTADWAGNSRFQVNGPGGQYVCDLESQCCACRKWELTGIPCRHGVAAIIYSGLNVEQFVHECYKTRNCVELYSNFIEPSNGSHLWPDSDASPLEPPIYDVKPGQSQHKRRLEAGEKRKKASKSEASATGKQKLERTYRNIGKCTKCGVKGHNKRSCGKEKVKRIRTKLAPQRANNDHSPAEVPVEPVPTSQGPNRESFFYAYKRHFKIDEASGSQGKGETVMQRQAHQSQPSSAVNTSITSRGNKILFSSQPHY